MALGGNKSRKSSSSSSSSSNNSPSVDKLGEVYFINYSIQIGDDVIHSITPKYGIKIAPDDASPKIQWVFKMLKVIESKQLEFDKMSKAKQAKYIRPELADVVKLNVSSVILLGAADESTDEPNFDLKLKNS